MHITRETKVSIELAEQFWELYDVTFEPLKIASPCRQFMRHDEFIAEMSDPRMLKFVLWDDNELAVAMVLLATDLGAVDWISSEYFEAKYPEHFADGRIYYFGAFLVEPSSQGMHYGELILDELGNFITRSNGIAAFDCYAGNNEWMPAMVTAVACKEAVIEAVELETQHYYVLITKGFLEGFGPSKYA